MNDADMVWASANQRYLATAIARLEARLRAHLGVGKAGGQQEADGTGPDEAAVAVPPPSTSW